MSLNPYEWKTISVTALPLGWINIFKSADGSYWTAPAPALLIQESDLDNLKRTPGDETRAVFAFSDEGYLVSATDWPGYEYTTTEQDYALEKAAS